MAKLSLEEALMLELAKEEKRNVNSKLEEKTLKQIYNELPGVDVHDEPIDTSNVDALLDGVIVVTDPSVTKDEYGEVQQRAQEIIENTPEGDMPFDEEYVDSYLITCPICGETFTSPELLHPGDTCPVCLQQPEEFITKGQLKTTEEVSEMANEQEALDDAKIAANEENEDAEEAVPGVEENTLEDEEQEPERQTASKEIPQGNKLQETKQDDKTIKTESNYDSFEDFKNEVKSVGSLYDYVYRHYYKMPLDLLKEIALNAIYEADNDEAIMSDMKERVFESKSIMKEDSYEDGIFYEIEEALREAGLNPVRFTDDGVMTNNLGWTVTGEDGTQQQITCDGSYLTESKSDEVTVGNIKQKAQELLPAEDIETHDSDLYLKVSDKSTELVNKLKDKESGLLKTFKSEKDNSMWYDIPFANMEDDYKLKNNLNESEIEDDFIELSDINN